MSNNAAAAANALAPDTQRAPSYALQEQSVCGYLPAGVLGTPDAPSQAQGTSFGITFHTRPGLPYDPLGTDESILLQLPFGSHVTQVVAEAVFPADRLPPVIPPAALPASVDTVTFNVGSGYKNGFLGNHTGGLPLAPGAQPVYQGGQMFLENTSGGQLKLKVLKNQDNALSWGTTGYFSLAPAAEVNFVNLGNGTTPASVGGLQEPALAGATLKVTLTYTTLVCPTTNLHQPINQSRPSYLGA